MPMHGAVLLIMPKTWENMMSVERLMMLLLAFGMVLGVRCLNVLMLCVGSAAFIVIVSF